MRTEHRLAPSDVEPILHQVSEGWRILMFDNLEAGWELVEELVRESQGTGIARARALRSVGILARVRGASGSALDLHANLSIDQNSGSVTGTLTGRPVAG